MHILLTRILLVCTFPKVPRLIFPFSFFSPCSTQNYYLGTYLDGMTDFTRHINTQKIIAMMHIFFFYKYSFSYRIFYGKNALYKKPKGKKMRRKHCYDLDNVGRNTGTPVY